MIVHLFNETAELLLLLTPLLKMSSPTTPLSRRNASQDKGSNFRLLLAVELDGSVNPLVSPPSLKTKAYHGHIDALALKDNFYKY